MKLTSTIRAYMAANGAKGGAALTGPAKATRTKLNPSLVKAIRAARATGETAVSVARRYNIHPSMVRKIVNRECWGWLE